MSKSSQAADAGRTAREAADYALLIAKQGNAALIAINAVRMQDVKYRLTDMLVEDIETPTAADSVFQRIRGDAQKWMLSSKKSSVNGIRLRTALAIDSTEIADNCGLYRP